MKPPRSRLHPALCLPSFLLLMAPAHANPNDALQFSAGYSISHEDNLFRLSDKGAAPALIGRATPAETINAATAGLRFDKEYGLQRVRFDTTAVRYDYQNFSYLTFTALNYNGILDWQFTPRLRGTVQRQRTQTLNTFSDFNNYSVQNRRTVITSAASGSYELDGAWRLTGGVNRIELQNSALIVQQRAFTIDSVQAGVKRTFGTGSEMSYQARRGSGKYTENAFTASNLLPSSYDETENELGLVWALTSKTRLVNRISYLQRSFNQFDFRDYSGVTASSALDWSLSSRVRLRLGWARDLSDYQTSYSSYGINNTFTLAPSWQIKEKMQLTLRHDQTQRRFTGAGTPTGIDRQREDDQSLTRLSLDWEPREFMTFSTWLQRVSRDSNFPGAGFTSNSAGVSAQVSF